jgi:hypothetical protein
MSFLHSGGMRNTRIRENYGYGHFVATVFSHACYANGIILKRIFLQNLFSELEDQSLIGRIY